MGTVYLLTLRQLTGRWRVGVLLLLAAVPVLVTLLVLRSAEAPRVDAFEIVIVNGMLTGSIIPLVLLAIGAAAFGNEVEDRTLANLTVAPLARWRIVVAKLLAVVSVSAPFVVAGAALTAHLAYLGDLRAVLAVVGGALLAVLLYGTVFVWLGLASPQAVGLGLLYIVLWEGFFAGFVAGVRLLSIRYHAVAAMHAIDPRRFADAPHPGGAAVAAVAAVVLVGVGWLTVRRLRRMDVG